MSIIAEIQKCEQQTEKLKQAVQSKIASLPDNPRIKRINKNCFIMSSKDLGNDWTVEHHDFKKQYELLNEQISKRTPAEAIRFLEKAIVKGGFKFDSQRWRVKFHLDVLSFLQGLCAELRGIKTCTMLFQTT